jgi:hypothetical protein
MNNSPSLKKTLRALASCALALVCFYRPATAAPPMRDLSAEIAALRGAVTSARMYHFPDGFSTNRALKEADITKDCYYAADSRDDLDTLLDVLVSAGLKQSQPNPNGFDARTVVYLTKRDGTTIPLVLSITYSNAPMQGMYDHAVPVEANMNFGEALRNWRRRHTPTSLTTEKCIAD